MGEKKKSSYHHGDLRNALVEAGEALLEREGVKGLSLRKVAKAAGVSHTAPYRHFRDKDALLGEIAREGFLALAGEMRKAFEAHKGSPREQFLAAGSAYVRLAVDNVARTQLMFGGHLDKEVCEGLGEDAQEAYQSFYRIIEYGAAAGFYPSAHDVDALALTAWSCVHGLAMLIAGQQLREPPQGEEEQERIARHSCSLLLDGMIHEGGLTST